MSRRTTGMTRRTVQSQETTNAETSALTLQARAAGFKLRLRLARASDKSRAKFWNAIDKTLGAFPQDPDVAAALAIGPDIVKNSQAGTHLRARHNVHEIRVGAGRRFIGVWFDKGETRFLFVLDTAVKETLRKDDHTSADAQSLNAFTNAFCQLLDGTFPRPNGHLEASHRPTVMAAGTDRLMRNPRHAATTQAKLQELQALVVTHDGSLDLRTKEGRMQWAIKSLLHSDEAETIAARNLVGELNRLRRGRYPRDAKLTMTGYRRLNENDKVPAYVEYDRAYGEQGLVVPEESQRDVVCQLWWYGVQPHLSDTYIADRLGRDFGLTSKDHQPISRTVLPNLTPDERKLLTRLNGSDNPSDWKTKPLHLLSDGGKRLAIKAMYQPHKIVTYATGSYAAEWAGRVANQFTYEGGHTMTPRVGVANDTYGSAIFTLPFGLPPRVELDRAAGLPRRNADGNHIPVFDGEGNTVFGWGPTFDDWLDVLTLRSLRGPEADSKQSINTKLRHPLACFQPWTHDGLEWTVGARTAYLGSTDYEVRTRSLDARHDELQRYRPWSRAAGDCGHEVLTPAAELEMALAKDLTAAASGLILGSLPSTRVNQPAAPPASRDASDELAAARRTVSRLEREARALRRKTALLADAMEHGEAQAEGSSVEELPAYQADLDATNEDLAKARKKLAKLEACPEPSQEAARPAEADYGNVAWVIAALHRTQGRAVDPRLAAAVQSLVRDLRIRRTADGLAALVAYTVHLPLGDGSTVETPRQFMVSNKRMGSGARPAGQRQRNDAVAELFLRDGMSIDDITELGRGSLDPALTHRALAQALARLLPGKAQGARRFIRHTASPRHRQAMYHALMGTPAKERPDWLGDEFAPYLQHLAQVLRTGTLSIEDKALGYRQPSLEAILEGNHPAEGAPIAELSNALGVRPLTISNQAVHSQSRGGPHPATLAKVTYYDNVTAPSDRQPPRVRPIRCAYQDCPSPWASTVLWLPELLNLGTGVVCPDCRRPSKVAYTAAMEPGGGIAWQVTDQTAGGFKIPQL